MAEVYASISVTVIEDAGPGRRTMHTRSWELPAQAAIPFADYLAVEFGQPSEMITDPDAMTRGGERAAAAGEAVFLIDGEVHGG